MTDTMGGEYRNARLRMMSLAGELSDQDATTIVAACPAWTIKDLFSHVAGIATDLGSGNRPSGDTQAWVDAQIESRRTRSLSSVVDEWATNAPAFEAMIDAVPQQLWTLTYDTVVHEHDLFTAAGRRGDRGSDGVVLAAELGMKLVKGDLKRTGLGAFRAVIDGREHVVGEGDPTLTLRADSFEALRLLGSRRTIDEMRRAAFDGDVEAMLAGLVHMDLPEVSLGEDLL